MMSKQPDAAKLTQELAAARALIEAHPNIQQMLDLAADEADRRALDNERSRRLAWRVATGCGAMGFAAILAAGGAIATSMRPAPPPEILVVNRTDGSTQRLTSLIEFQLNPEEATIRRNVSTFMSAREGYSYEQADTHYYTTAAFLSPQLQTQWGQMWDASNPDSPLRKFKKERRVRVTVGAITILRNGLGAVIGARAGFTKTELANDVEDGAPTSWIANISFHWVNQPTSERDRRINDLGMEITDYTADRDIGTGRSMPAKPVREAAQRNASPMALVSPTNTQQVTP
jgi:type IV secretion system protein VirB8